MLEHLSTVLYPKYNFYHITQPNFSEQFKAIEANHPQKKKTFKIAFIYSNGTERCMLDFFNHSMRRYVSFIYLVTLVISSVS
jgi:hypothetical protein